MTFSVTLKAINNVREFNRVYTREMGILNERFLDSGFTLPELRVLFEVASNRSLMTSQLAQSLCMDQGYVSRIVTTLKKEGLVTSQPNPNDKRQKILTLTSLGESTYAELETSVQVDIRNQLEEFTPEDQQQMIEAMNTITRLIKKSGNKNSLIRPIRLGDLGHIIKRHVDLYAREYGWGQSFELAVMEVLTSFLKNFDPQYEQGWVAEVDGEFAGCIFAVKENDSTARLRALLVEPKFRCLGIGNQLIEQCLDFCRSKQYGTVVLWTCDALTQARKLYSKHGFIRTSQWPEKEFGSSLISEDWALDLP
ncbi:GNAT family N-acetyltransferase [Neptuniibacter sp. QD37_6]|uniref:bifunctional helix-turn-helix transcriptional regulator/GNAT family N-acetyltransferase n=1 Tax=Neptuniibacter sp. QD37_6 TaxID=3398210 RepID=UPI0039F56EA3